MRPRPPIVCYWCDRPQSHAADLFANGHGWTRTCDDCLAAVAPAPAGDIVRQAA